ncbi:MAG: glycosyltransferase family 1 protein [Bdellovibrionota bacterium]
MKADRTQPFRIGIDARATEPGFKAHFGRGTGRYATELVSRLVGSSPDSDDPLRVLPFLAKDLKSKPWEAKVIELLPFGRQTAETQFFLPKRLQTLGFDLLHFVAHGDATARCGVPYVVTVLDLIPLKFPDLYKADKADWRFRLARKLEEQSIRNASGIVAISEATKRDLVEILGIPPERVVVTPLGVSNRFTPRSPILAEWQLEARRTKERLGLPVDRPMLLYAGGIDPRKNVPFLLSVFSEVLKYNWAVRPVLALVGAYENDRCYPALRELIQRLGLQNDVVLQGFVSEDDLPLVYRAAHLKLFPSLYEGFGLPVLEALASGAPVIAGNNSSIPEVAGNAALLLEDNNRSSWVTEILALLQNETRQGQLSQAGKMQARKFTWDHTARTTLEAYRFFAALDAPRAASAAIGNSIP